MVGAVISAVLKKFGEIAVDRISYEYKLVTGVKKELLGLPDMLLKARERLDDAEYKGLKDERVRRWLKKLEKAAYEIEDILDEWNYKSLLKQNAEASASPQNTEAAEASVASRLGLPTLNTVGNLIESTFSSHDIAYKIKNVKSTLDQLLQERNDFTFETSSQRNTDHVRKSTSLIDGKKVFGSDIQKKKSEIVSKLTLGGDGIQILSIVGDGGLGKTTLAQLIFNDPQFGTDWLKIWVCVSSPFVVDVVAANIFNRVGQETIPTHNDQPEFALQKLIAAISEKKYLLVLDDVWTEDEKEWEPLKVALTNGKPGSKILVTTRKKGVADAMGTLEDDILYPENLTVGECWEILRDTSSLARERDEYGEFEEVGKKIAIKCKGLPLVAVVLGKLLKSKDLDMWKEVEKSEIWKLKNTEVELFPVWVLSYNDLSADLKRCFSYCAVYPKDHKIHAETLIEEWMAQGYLGSDSGNGALELIGRENLNNLAMRSLFQDIEKSESGGQIEWCKMHDIVHDFALFLRKNDVKESCQACESSLVSHVQEYRSLSWDRNCQVCDCMKSLRVLRIKRGHPPVGMETLIHLRWLDFSRNKLSKDGLKIICRLYFLQTLLLSRCDLTEIPREIGNLVQLRRLDLSMNSELELTESIGCLIELRTLSLQGCSLKEIPQEIGNLGKLRRLDLSWNEQLRELPKSMYSLVELQTLSLAYCGLREIRREIGNLVELRILEISGTDINSLPEAFSKLSNLRTLELRKFKVANQYKKLGLLKKLHCCLTGSLILEIYCSSMSELVELFENARQAQLKTRLQKLETLKISFMGTMNEKEQSSSSSSSMWMEVVEALVPLHKLNRLEISEYKGSRLPHLMSSPLNFIKVIHLRWVTEVSSFPAMGKLPFLEILYIWKVKQLKLVGQEFLGLEPSSDDVVAFPKLERLSFESCSKWEEWEDITEEEEVSAAISIMPCLTNLVIKDCCSLKKLPHRLLHKVSSSLRLLNISGSSELENTYGEDKEGSAWRSISQHNPQLVLLQVWF